MRIVLSYRFGIAVAAVCAVVVGWACAAQGEDFPDRYWPSFPTPERIVVSESHNGLRFEEGVLLQTLSGLVAFQTRTRGKGELIWIGTTSNSSYDEWFERRLQRGNIPVERGPVKVWDLVDRYSASGVLKGYVLYRKDTSKRQLYEGTPADCSVNVATALCAVLGGVAVEERIESDAKAHGLAVLIDVRGKNERWLWSTYGGKVSHDVVGMQDPKSEIVRDALVAMNTLVLSGVGPLHEEVLGHMRPGSPALGWGIGAEDAQTGPASRHAVFQTATNWCVNLPLLSSGVTGLDYPMKPLPRPADADQEDDGQKRYVSFVMSDGDNVQWLMLNFCKGEQASQYWACPDRGKVPLGRTVPVMDLLQLCPYTLDYLSQTASRNDDFMLLGGGYYYPDWFGKSSADKEVLVKHARRTGKYMDKGGVTNLLINVQDWKSADAQHAYETYVKEMPNLKAIFIVQYAPYTAGGGAIRWVMAPTGRAIPVITARNAIWSQRGDNPVEGGPSRVAAMLNSWAEQPVEKPEDRFAWVIVHCWSWFKHIAPDQSALSEEVEQKEYTATEKNIARGYRPALWCAERLSPKVTVVTPSALVNRLTQAHAGAMSR